MTISLVPAISLDVPGALQAAVTTAKATVAIAACRLAFVWSFILNGLFAVLYLLDQRVVN